MSYCAVPYSALSAQRELLAEADAEAVAERRRATAARVAVRQVEDAPAIFAAGGEPYLKRLQVHEAPLLRQLTRALMRTVYLRCTRRARGRTASAAPRKVTGS